MFEELIVRLASEFKRADLAYMIIGGQAVLLYGNPRMTKDIDITLGVNVDELGRVIGIVEAALLEVIPRNFKDFVERTFVLPTRDPVTNIRVDFIFSFSPYERQAIARARAIILQETPVMFATLEDIIIHKIFAGRPRDIEDVQSMIIKNPGFDRDYTRKWLKQFDESQDSDNFTRTFEDLLR
jgi:hypothetical protein